MELLIVAGADPSVFDNDHNRPIDLVSTDDTATQHTLKRAMTDRDAIVNELMEIHARGFQPSTRSFNGSSGNRLSGTSFGSFGTPIGRSSSSMFEDAAFMQQLGSRNRVNMPDQLSLISGSNRNSSSSRLHRQGSQTSFNSTMSAGYNAGESDTSFVSEAMSEPLHSVLAPKAVRRKKSSDRDAKLSPNVVHEMLRRSRSPPPSNADRSSLNSKRSSSSSVERIMHRITSVPSNPIQVTSTSSVKSDSDNETFDAGSTSTIRDDADIASIESFNEDSDVEHQEEQNIHQRTMVPEIVRLPVHHGTTSYVNTPDIVPPTSKQQVLSVPAVSDSDDTFFDDSFDTEISEIPIPAERVYVNVNNDRKESTGTLDRKEQALLLEQAPQLKTWLSDQATLMNKFAEHAQIEAMKGNLDSDGHIMPSSPDKSPHEETDMNKRPLPPVPISHKFDSVVDSIQKSQKLNDLNNPPANSSLSVPIPRPRRRKPNGELDSSVSDTSFSASENNNVSIESESSMFWDDTGTSMMAVGQAMPAVSQALQMRQRTAAYNTEDVLNCSSSSSSTAVSDSVPNSGHQVAQLFDPVCMKKMQKVSPTLKPYSFANGDGGISEHLTQSIGESIVNDYDFMSKIGQLETVNKAELADQVNLTLADAELSRDTILDHEIIGEPENDAFQEPTSPPGRRKGFNDPRPELNKQYLMDYEDVPAKQNRKVTIGKDQIFQEPPRTPKDHDHRVVTFNNQGRNRINIVGGNSEGIFVQHIEPGSEAEFAGLMEGDQILKINGRSIKNKTKEEVTLILLTLTQVVSLVVRLKQDRYEGIMNNGGMGDSFFVKANFNYDATQDGEISFSNGDILSIRDTMPDGKVGCWRALKTHARPDEDQHGLIPNDSRGEQIALTQKKARELSMDNVNRGGFFRRSLRKSRSTQNIHKTGRAIKRSKSVDRIAADNISITSIAAGTLKAYERVEQRPPGLIRPVVLLGIFCEAVRDKLIAESPGRYEKPDGIVNLPENVDDESTNKDIDLRPVQNVINRRHHCLMLASPRAVQFIRAANMHPIVIYLSPGSKSLVKHMRSKLDPNLEKRSAFMYEEAVHFGKMHSELFTATVTYTSDDSWYTLLKDTIGRMQSQTLWQPVIPVELEETAESFSDFSPEPSPIPQAHTFKHLNNANGEISPSVQDILHKHALNNNHLEHPYQDSIDSASLSSQDYTYKPLGSPTPSLSSTGKPKSILKRGSSSSLSSQKQERVIQDDHPPEVIRIRTHPLVPSQPPPEAQRRAIPIHRPPAGPPRSSGPQRSTAPNVHQVKSQSAPMPHPNQRPPAQMPHPNQRPPLATARRTQRIAAVKPRQQVMICNSIEVL